MSVGERQPFEFEIQMLKHKLRSDPQIIISVNNYEIGSYNK